MKHWACLQQPQICPQSHIHQKIQLNFDCRLPSCNKPAYIIYHSCCHQHYQHFQFFLTVSPSHRRIRILDGITSNKYCTHYRHHVVSQWLSVCLIHAFVYKYIYTLVCKRLCICASQVVIRLNVMRQLQKSPKNLCSQTPPSACHKIVANILDWECHSDTVVNTDICFYLHRTATPKASTDFIPQSDHPISWM
jgi:hypothetical protein